MAVKLFKFGSFLLCILSSQLLGLCTGQRIWNCTSPGLHMLDPLSWMSTTCKSAIGFTIATHIAGMLDVSHASPIGFGNPTFYPQCSILHRASHSPLHGFVGVIPASSFKPGRSQACRGDILFAQIIFENQLIMQPHEHHRTQVSNIGVHVLEWPTALSLRARAIAHPLHMSFIRDNVWSAPQVMRCLTKWLCGCSMFAQWLHDS